MVEYKCFRCGYIAKQKSNLVNHLKRKNICLPKNDDVSIESIINYYGFEVNQFEPKLNPNDEKNKVKKLNPNEPKLKKFEPKMNPKWVQKQVSKMYTCHYCNKSYTTNSHMRRHEKNCKIKNKLELENEFLKDKVDCLQETVEKLLCESKANIINNTKHIDNSINNDNSTHINVISLNNYGKENTEYITKEYLMGLLEKPFQSIPELIKYTHFNKEHPENQNIKLPNKKEPYVKILKGNKWELADRKDTINDLIDQKHSMLNTVDLKKNFGLPVSNRIEIFNNKYLNDDKELLNKLYKDSELVLLNNS